jgi:prophage regulatory protein
MPIYKYVQSRKIHLIFSTRAFNVVEVYINMVKVKMRILGEKELLRKVPVSRMTLWNWEKSGTFPKRLKLSSGRVGWIESEVDKWLAEKAAQRYGA